MLTWNHTIIKLMPLCRIFKCVIVSCLHIDSGKLWNCQTRIWVCPLTLISRITVHTLGKLFIWTNCLSVLSTSQAWYKWNNVESAWYAQPTNSDIILLNIFIDVIISQRQLKATLETHHCTRILSFIVVLLQKIWFNL